MSSKSFGKIKNDWSSGEKQIKALKEHGKQPVKYSSKKEFLTHLKQKEIFKKLDNKGIDEIQNLSKQNWF